MPDIKNWPGGIIEFRDMDQFNAAVEGWNIEFRQLQRGPMSARVSQFQTTSNFYNRVHFSRAIAQSGAPVAGMLTFGVVEAAPWATWEKSELPPWRLLRFSRDREFQSVSSEGFCATTLSFNELEFASTAERLGHPEVLLLPADESVLNPDTRKLRQLLKAVGQALIEAPSDEDAPAQRKRQRNIDSDLSIDLIMLIAHCQAGERQPKLRSRSRMVRTAVGFILDNAHEAVTVADVCAATRVSVRTLDRAFREHLQTSPKECISSVRLQGARQVLKSSGSETRVADVANEWGFWHLGDFARVYRREFNELPSDTLQR